MAGVVQKYLFVNRVFTAIAQGIPPPNNFVITTLKTCFNKLGLRIFLTPSHLLL